MSVAAPTRGLAFAIVASVVATIACGGGKPDEPRNPDAAKTGAKPWEGIGQAEDPNTACSLKSTDPQRKWCFGFLAKKVELPQGSSPGNVKELATIVGDLSRDARKWREQSPRVLRKKKSGASGNTPYMKVSTLIDARNVPLDRLQGEEGLVVARLDAERGSAIDDKYDAGDISGQSLSYFVVVSNYKDDPNDVLEEGRAIVDWAIYGIKITVNGPTTDSVLVPTGRTGKLRYCQWKHKSHQRKDGANFLKCIDAPYGGLLDSVQTELERRRAPRDTVTEDDIRSAFDAIAKRSPSFVSAVMVQVDSGLTGTAFSEMAVRTLTRIYAEGPEDPAWMACGAGCCVADESSRKTTASVRPVAKLH